MYEPWATLIAPAYMPQAHGKFCWTFQYPVDGRTKIPPRPQILGQIFYQILG